MSSYARIPAQEVAERCAILENRLFDLADEKAVKLVGVNRRAALPPLDLSKNVLGQMVSILGRILRPTPAVSGLDPRLASLIGDSSSSATRDAYANLKTPHSPMPTSLLRGAGKHGGLQRGARYVHGVGYSGQLVDWSSAEKRPYTMTVRPCDLDVLTDPDDPSRWTGYLHRRTRTISGKVQQVTDFWDLRDIEAPSFRVLKGFVYPVDGALPNGVEDALPAKTGPRYWWRYDDGRAFSPLVIYGTPIAVYDLTNVASATLQSMVYRLCLAGVFLDSGFPVENVENLRLPTNTKDDVAFSDMNRGDTRQWIKAVENDATGHWTTPAGDKPKELLDAILAYEADVADQVGIPLRTESAGGAPMQEAIAAQEEEIAAWYDTFRSADSVLLRRLAAIANRAGEAGLHEWSPVSEALPGVLYRSEIKAAAKPKAEPKTPAEDKTEDSEETKTQEKPDDSQDPE